MADASISYAYAVRAPGFWNKLKGVRAAPTTAGKNSAPLPAPSYTPAQGRNSTAPGRGSHYFPGNRQTFPPTVESAHINDDTASVASDDTAPTNGPNSNASSANSFLSARNAESGDRPQTFFVPLYTGCYVSSGDGNWHFGLWGDNHRTVALIDPQANLEMGSIVLGQRGAPEGQQQLFVRYADVLLLDSHGHSMFMAANRKRPCLIRFAPRSVLYVETEAGFTPVASE